MDENGYRVARDCDCLAQRKTLRKIERSGLASTLQQLTFESYQVRSDWQSFVKNSALEFMEHPSHCFYIGGNTGAGKTHICTAICGELIRKGYEVRYYLWRELLHRLEANRFKEYEYSQIMGEIQSADVLYLDDFLKSKGEKKQVSNALEYAFEVINQRYIAQKITIISSGWYLDEIFSLDNATGGRIHEMCGRPDRFELKLIRDERKNQRFAMETS